MPAETFFEPIDAAQLDQVLKRRLTEAHLSELLLAFGLASEANVQGASVKRGHFRLAFEFYDTVLGESAAAGPDDDAGADPKATRRERIFSHIRGIDLSRPVRLGWLTLHGALTAYRRPGTSASDQLRYVSVNRGTPAQRLGINPGERRRTAAYEEHHLGRSVLALQSVCAGIRGYGITTLNSRMTLKPPVRTGGLRTETGVAVWTAERHAELHAGGGQQYAVSFIDAPR